MFDGWKTKLIKEVINQKMGFVMVLVWLERGRKAWTIRKKSEMLKWCRVVVGLLLCYQRSGVDFAIAGDEWKTMLICKEKLFFEGESLDG